MSRAARAPLGAAFASVLIAVLAVPGVGVAASGDDERVDGRPRIEEVRSRLAEEGIVDVRGVKATFLVAAPPPRVLETLWNVDRFLEIFPDIDRLEVRRRTETLVEAEFGVKLMLGETTYVLRRELHAKDGAIRWREIGGDLKTVRGAWKVEATANPGVSRVTYLSFVDLGRMVPDALVRKVAMSKVDALADRVRAACVAPRDSNIQKND